MTMLDKIPKQTYDCFRCNRRRRITSRRPKPHDGVCGTCKGHAKQRRDRRIKATLLTLSVISGKLLRQVVESALFDKALQLVTFGSCSSLEDHMKALNTEYDKLFASLTHEEIFYQRREKKPA